MTLFVLVFIYEYGSCVVTCKYSQIHGENADDSTPNRYNNWLVRFTHILINYCAAFGYHSILYRNNLFLPSFVSIYVAQNRSAVAEQFYINNLSSLCIRSRLYVIFYSKEFTEFCPLMLMLSNVCSPISFYISDIELFDYSVKFQFP